MGGADGPTHHGIFGTAFLRHVPNLQVYNPRSVEEMQAMLRYALTQDSPVFIRYPRSEHSLMQSLPFAGFTPGKWEVMTEKGDVTLLATGPLVAETMLAREMLLKQSISARVINASSMKPLDLSCMRELSLSQTPYYVLEEQALAGGLGSAISETCVQEGLRLPEHIFAVPDRFIPHGSHGELLKECGLDAKSIADFLAAKMSKTA